MLSIFGSKVSASRNLSPSHLKVGAFVGSAAVKFNQIIFRLKRKYFVCNKTVRSLKSIRFKWEGQNSTKKTWNNRFITFWNQAAYSWALMRFLSEPRNGFNQMLFVAVERARGRNKVFFSWGILCNEFFRPNKLKRKQTRAGRSTYNKESSQIAVGLGLFSLPCSLSYSSLRCLSRSNEKNVFEIRSWCELQCYCFCCYFNRRDDVAKQVAKCWQGKITANDNDQILWGKSIKH